MNSLDIRAAWATYKILMHVGLSREEARAYAAAQLRRDRVKFQIMGAQRSVMA